DVATKQRADVMVEGVAIQCNRVGVLHQPGHWTDDARDADANRGIDAEPILCIAHQCGYRLQQCLVPSRRVDAMTKLFCAVRIKDDDFNFSAPEVHPDSVPDHRHNLAAHPQAVLFVPPSCIEWCVELALLG